MIEIPKLTAKPLIENETFGYMCSSCSQPFLPPEDRSPKEAMEEVWEAFNEHIRDEHSMERA